MAMASVMDAGTTTRRTARNSGSTKVAMAIMAVRKKGCPFHGTGHSGGWDGCFGNPKSKNYCEGYELPMPHTILDY
jgi:hypothetical protein